MMTDRQCAVLKDAARTTDAKGLVLTGPGEWAAARALRNAHCGQVIVEISSAGRVGLFVINDHGRKLAKELP